jgi:hypothetical protein
MQGRLEYTEYEGIVQEHVNCYIAFKQGGKLKVKGRFAHEVPLNKNNTKDITRIQRIAIQEYFSKKIPVAETVMTCTDIMKFCFGYKSRKFNFLGTDLSGKVTDYGHLLRCYASTEGVRLSKSKEEDEDSGASTSKLFKDSLATPYNYHVSRPMAEYKVNMNWYIHHTQDIIRAIEACSISGKKRKPPPPPNASQTSLF